MKKKPTLEDMVKAAHKAGVKVDVSLEPNEGVSVAASKVDSAIRQLEWLAHVADPENAQKSPVPLSFYDAGAAFAFRIAASIVKGLKP